MEKGWDKMLEFGKHEHSVFGNIKNVLTAFGVNLLWVIFIVAFLRLVVSMTIDEVKTLLTAQVLANGPGKTFFFAVVFAPLWEEAFFRYCPLHIAWACENEYSGSIKDAVFLYPVMIFSSIAFGVAHGGVTNILIQGFSGLVLAWVMVKSGYKWAVLTHALWNFLLIFGLPSLLR